MIMDAQKCLQILREIKDVSFATVDASGFPQNRIIDIMIVEDEKIYFCTARGKDFYNQLVGNGRVAVTGMNGQYQMVRLSGMARRITEQKTWIDRIFEENPSMNSVYPNESRYILEPFCIADGQIEFFDLGKSPIYREDFFIGNGKALHKGFQITDACIGCGKCKRSCPQQCIAQGEPYAIAQSHCLHCGLCFEVCPVKAVEKRSV